MALKQLKVKVTHIKKKNISNVLYILKIDQYILRFSNLLEKNDSKCYSNIKDINGVIEEALSSNWFDSKSFDFNSIYSSSIAGRHVGVGAGE
jgi:hypothetical protein